VARVVVFGVKDFAELAHYYLVNDSSHEVTAFSVNEAYMPRERTFRGLPIVAFEDVESHYPPSDYAFFAPMSPSNMNLDREAVYRTIKGKGYGCISYVSSKATVFDNVIGENCFVLEDNTIQPHTTIGNDVVLFGGNFIGHHGIVQDHVSFSLHAVVGGHCTVGAYSFLGLNSTIRNGVKLGEGTFVAMAAAVAGDTESWCAYRGNPAEKLSKPSVSMKI
jgi:sugar O-acyltransferase (sialic acid O-acetyltransferase NeuD family)